MAENFTRMNESRMTKKINYIANIKATTKRIEKTCCNNWDKTKLKVDEFQRLQVYKI